MAGKEKKDCGMRFPPQIDTVTGRFMVSEGAEHIKESVYLILGTQKTERLQRPEFGSDTMSYVFMEPSKTKLHILERRLAETVLSQEPGIRDLNIEASLSDEKGELIVRAEYTVREGGRRDQVAICHGRGREWTTDSGQERAWRKN